MTRVRPTKPTQPDAFSGPFTLVFRPLTALFWIFGFDLGTDPGQWSVAKTILRILLRLILLIFIYQACALSYPCIVMLLNNKKNIRSECVPVTLRTNIFDVFFGVICYLVLVMNEKRLAAIFVRKGNEAFEELGMRRGQTSVRKWFFFAAFLTLLSLVLSIVATTGLISASKWPTLIFGSFRVVVQRIYKQHCVLPLRILSTLFCGLYAMACLKLRFGLRKLAENNDCASLDEFEGRYAKIRHLVRDVDAVFSSTMPLLFFCRFLTLGVWIEFALAGPHLTELPKLLAVFQHVLQCFCLIVPPILFNETARKSLDIELTNTISSSQRGVYTSYDYSGSVSPKVNLMMMQMASDPPRMTAGGHPISTWIVVTALMISWLYLAISWLELVVKTGFENHFRKMSATSETPSTGSSLATFTTKKTLLTFPTKKTTLTFPTKRTTFTSELFNLTPGN